MKKLSTIAILTLALFLSACSPEYDFSSGDALRESAIKKGVSEGFSKEEAKAIYGLYATTLTLKIVNSKNANFASEKDILEKIKSEMQGKSFKELQKEILNFK